MLLAVAGDGGATRRSRGCYYQRSYVLPAVHRDAARVPTMLQAHKLSPELFADATRTAVLQEEGVPATTGGRRCCRRTALPVVLPGMLLTVLQRAWVRHGKRGSEVLEETGGGVS